MTANPDHNTRPESYTISTASVGAVLAAGLNAAGAWLRAHLRGHRGLQGLGLALLLIWIVWIGLCSTAQPLPRLVPAPSGQQDRLTYIPLLPLAGMDFHHNHAAVRTWRAGRDPYAELPGDPNNQKYVYSPVVLAAFAWTDLFPPGLELRVVRSDGSASLFNPSLPCIATWFALSVLILVAATWKSWRVRTRLGLHDLPVTLALGLVLFSYPVIFELERGNCDVLVLAAVMTAIRAMEATPGTRWDALVGFCVAFAVGMKPYAAVLVPGLLVLRRYRAAGWAAGWLLLGAVFFSPGLRAWTAVAEAYNRTDRETFADFSHTLVGVWRLLWRELGLPNLARLPATPTVTAAVAAYAAWPSWRVWRQGCDRALEWPFLLWLTAWGTLLLPISNDYNLIFIPLAVLAVWNARDPWWVHAGVTSVAVWCQPFFIGFTHLPWLAIKVSSLAFVGILVVRRLHRPRDAY